MKICLAGKNNIAVEIADYLINEYKIKNEDLFIILNKTDSGIDTWQKSLKKYANDNFLKIVSLEEVYNLEELVFLSLEFDTIIKTEKFMTSRIYNIHFSLLPKYRGMYTSIMPILNNEILSGVTLHKIDNGIDTGNILDQIKFEIEYTDNSRDLYFKYLKYGINLIKNNLIELLSNKNLSEVKQNFLEASYYSKKEINFSNININLNQVSINIHNNIRAFNFREYQIPTIFEDKIISSKILIKRSKSKPATVLFEDDISYVISTIDNDIILYKDRSIDLLKACELGNLNLVSRLVNIPKIINVQNEKGWSALIIAIYNNQKDIVKILLENDADVNITNFNGTTILMYAKSSFIIYNDSEILELILSLNLDINILDNAKKSVIDYCIENNEINALKIIKDKAS